LALRPFLLLPFLFLLACQRTPKAPASAQQLSDTTRVLPTTPAGVVEVLNGSGVKGAANIMARRLQDKGFDVVKVGNADEMNHAYTMIAVRRPGTAVGERLAQTLGVKRVLLFYNEALLVDATVFVGQDYQEILKP